MTLHSFYPALATSGPPPEAAARKARRYHHLGGGARAPASDYSLLLIVLLAAAASSSAAAPLAAAKKPPPPLYPAGACLSKAPSQNPCVSEQTCTAGPCSALTYASADPNHNSTYAVKDFGASCGARNEGCWPCALWRVIMFNCVDEEMCEPRPKDGVAVILAKERNGEGNLCFTLRHWMVLPLRPCPGIETAACTRGARGERYWEAIWKVGLEKGYPPSGRHDDGRLWGALINPTYGRSQHQMHLRASDLVTDRNNVISAFQNVTDVSTDTGAPTITEGAGDEFMASVFVRARDERRIAGVVKPFATGAAIAAAARPGAPYGLLLTKHAQRRSLNRPNSRAVDGFVVTAFVGSLRGGVLLDITTDNSKCPPSSCAAWTLGGKCRGAGPGCGDGASAGPIEWGEDDFYH